MALKRRKIKLNERFKSTFNKEFCSQKIFNKQLYNYRFDGFYLNNERIK